MRQGQLNAKGIYDKVWDEKSMLQKNNKIVAVTPSTNKPELDILPLNNEYYKYEDIGILGLADGKMRIPDGKGYLNIDDAFLEEKGSGNNRNNGPHTRINSGSGLMFNETESLNNSRLYSTRNLMQVP